MLQHSPKAPEQSKWSNMVQNGQNCPNGAEWSKTAQNGPNRPEWSKRSSMVQNGPKWSRMVQMVQMVQKSSKCKNGPKLSDMIQNSPDFSYGFPILKFQKDNFFGTPCMLSLNINLCVIHSESENTACSLMLTTVSSFLFSQHQKGWSKILYLHLDVKQIFDMYSTHSTHYVVQGSFHNSTDCNPILNMPFLPHFRFQNYPNIYLHSICGISPLSSISFFSAFLHYCWSKLNKPKSLPGSSKPRSICLMSQEMVTSMQRYL